MKKRAMLNRTFIPEHLFGKSPTKAGSTRCLLADDDAGTWPHAVVEVDDIL